MNVLKNILLFITGVLLLWLALKNLPFRELKNQLISADYRLIFPVFLATLFGYWVRIKRWGLLYESLGEKVSAKSKWVALSAGYLVSLGFPRAGEITRCLIIKRYNGTPVNKSLATVIVERITDIVVLLSLITIITLLNLGNTTSFFIDNILNPVYNKLGLKLLLIFCIIGSLVMIGLWFYLRNKNAGNNWVEELLIALKQLIDVKPKALYVFYTLCIWLSYFLMTYLWIFAFAESRSLSVLNVFIIMIVGTVGKSVPIQGGGMGAYHYLVAQVFLFFGVSLITGNALAIIIHGAQTLYTILTGSIAYVLLLIDEKNRKFAG